MRSPPDAKAAAALAYYTESDQPLAFPPTAVAAVPASFAYPPEAVNRRSRDEELVRPDARLEAELRAVQLENSRLRRTSTLPTSALSQAAKIMQLEEQLKESERRRVASEMAHAQASNEVIHALEAEIELLTRQRDVARAETASTVLRLSAAEARLQHESMVRVAQQQWCGDLRGDGDLELSLDESPTSTGPSTPTNMSPTKPDEPPGAGFGSSVRRALRRSKDAVRMSLPRTEIAERQASASGLPRATRLGE